MPPVARECRTVREASGCSTPRRSARSRSSGRTRRKFLNLIYTNPWMKLGVGKLRYGSCANEAGFIYDDGVVGRLAEDRFHVTTTTGGAPRVLPTWKTICRPNPAT
jgi:sarcosine oxidase subunit alpha